MSVSDLRKMQPEVETTRLGNGLVVAVMAERHTPIVATALAYRTGARDDPGDRGGMAHFLEHMMFKGSPRYGAGEIDRLTRALGGTNNAFTSHDLTLYYFTFAADRWHRALDIERDRMANLDFDPQEVDRERQVILEEIAMYEGEPWDALEQEVAAAVFSPHPYGRPVLGTRGELKASETADLHAFHELYYRPANAVLALAGDVGDGVLQRVEKAFAGLDGVAPERPRAEPAPRQPGLRRVERRAGEVARMMLSLPAPGATDPDHPWLRLLVAVLGSGRSSRLHRALVDEGQLCVGVSADVAESLDAGAVTVALEVLPGVAPEKVEATVLAELARLHAEPPSAEEVARARKIIMADWIFDHERVHQHAFLVAMSLTLFDLEHPWRYLERLLAAGPAELAEIGERYLDPEASGVLGWSLPSE